jgi:hypothetical protein
VIRGGFVQGPACRWMFYCVDEIVKETKEIRHGCPTPVAGFVLRFGNPRPVSWYLLLTVKDQRGIVARVAEVIAQKRSRPNVRSVSATTNSTNALPSADYGGGITAVV